MLLSTIFLIFGLSVDLICADKDVALGILLNFSLHCVAVCNATFLYTCTLPILFYVPLEKNSLSDEYMLYVHL
jgi:hypothetical protein